MSVVYLFAAILYASPECTSVGGGFGGGHRKWNRTGAGDHSTHPVLVRLYFSYLLPRRLSLNWRVIADCGRASNRDGNDGPWSSFQLRIGTPAQFPRVLISTTGYNSWVVLPQPGCNSSTVSCANSRGTLFSPNQSSTWHDLGIYTLDREQNLNYSTNANFGLDTVGIGPPGGSGPGLDSQIVGAFQNNVDYYLGQFGLAPFSTNLSTIANPYPNFITTLKAKNLIPSISWSYTAGAQYRKCPCSHFLATG